MQIDLDSVDRGRLGRAVIEFRLNSNEMSIR